MMNRSSCAKVGAASVVLLGLVAVSTFLFLNASYQQKKAHMQYLPPTVLVTNPIPGASILAGSYLPASGMATGVRPIVSVELWMDGELIETQKSEETTGLSPFFADFGLLVPSEGPHLLFLRAIDSAGLIGQSPLVSLVGVPKPAESYQAIQVQANQTVEEIAADYGIEPQFLRGLNQNLDTSPPAGAMIKVPAPPDEPEPSQQPPIPGGNLQIVIPDVPMMQIMSERSAGILPPGLFIPEPFAGSVAPPAAPTGLQAEVKDCKVILRWNDNATDEENYYVYVVPVTFHGFAIPFAYLKPSPATGPAWYEFQPTAGGSFSLWVEAANPYGSRPSNSVSVYVPYVSGCAAGVAHQLNITFLDMTVAGNFDRSYCYVSFENAPERRVPVFEDKFIKLQGGKSQGALPYSSFTLSVPNDGKIDLSGECWAWSGNDLSEIGVFSAALAQDAWNGDRQTLKGNSYEIGISLKPIPVLGTGMIGIESTDPTLPAPYAVREDPLPIELQSSYPLGRMLRWKWDGNPQKIDSYEIFLNGQPYVKTAGIINEQERQVALPGECGQPVRWQVGVRVGTAVSNLSAPLEYDLPPCQAYLRVSFNDIAFARTDDGFPGDSCDTLDAYFEISVRDVTRTFWNSNFVIPLKCPGYMFPEITGGPHLQLYGPAPYVITIPLAPGEDVSALWIKARFWDSDTGSSDDLFASFAEHPTGAYMPLTGEKWTSPLLNAQSSSECSISQRTGWSIFDEAKSSLGYIYSVYPNTCRDIPPPEGF